MKKKLLPVVYRQQLQWVWAMHCWIWVDSSSSDWSSLPWSRCVITALLAALQGCTGSHCAPADQSSCFQWLRFDLFFRLFVSVWEERKHSTWRQMKAIWAHFLYTAAGSTGVLNLLHQPFWQISVNSLHSAVSNSSTISDRPLPNQYHSSKIKNKENLFLLEVSKYDED